ncbi:hypothetical protein CMUS01_06479 [Colletotrichum musicola]|uniref:Uncharacterized protein n=1 Tax=Colletotrichum musicola TaxID=2175873 RepID=A0A8H6KLB3_9PEZI|nr:hypothetical protein CMUS01_06479 [Colletotrichum musicola]
MSGSSMPPSRAPRLTEPLRCTNNTELIRRHAAHRPSRWGAHCEESLLTGRSVVISGQMSFTLLPAAPGMVGDPPAQRTILQGDTPSQAAAAARPVENAAASGSRSREILPADRTLPVHTENVPTRNPPPSFDLPLRSRDESPRRKSSLEEELLSSTSKTTRSSPATERLFPRLPARDGTPRRRYSRLFDPASSRPTAARESRKPHTDRGPSLRQMICERSSSA